MEKAAKAKAATTSSPNMNASTMISCRSFTMTRDFKKEISPIINSYVSKDRISQLNLDEITDWQIDEQPYPIRDSTLAPSEKGRRGSVGGLHCRFPMPSQLRQCDVNLVYRARRINKMIRRNHGSRNFPPPSNNFMY